MLAAEAAGGFGAVIPPWLGNKSRAVTAPVGAYASIVKEGSTYDLTIFESEP